MNPVVLMAIGGLLFSTRCLAAFPPKDEETNAKGRPVAPSLPDNGFEYQFPKDVKKEALKGLNVKVEVVRTLAKESYFIDLYAALDDPEHQGKLKKIKLGQKAIFKPLKAEEQTTVYLDVPDKDAFRPDGKLWICWEVAAQGKRTPPDVELKILKVEPRARK